MKTAIQELIKELKYVQEFPMISGIIKRAELLLEKEKEQIIDSYYGKINGVFGYREEGEQYYNQTYNNETIN
jgi:hypothetical protein